MSDTQLKWLHFSDLHFCKELIDQPEFSRKLTSLWNDIGAFKEKGLEPDFIAVTGDIAQSGKKEDYELAQKFFFLPLLKATGLSSSKVFLVPGNHDVNWDCMIRMTSPLNDFKSDITL